MPVKDLTDKRTEGARFGQSADDLIAFHGATPTDQPAAIADISVTGTYGDDDDAIETAVNGILAVLREKGLIASS